MFVIWNVLIVCYQYQYQIWYLILLPDKIQRQVLLISLAPNSVFFRSLYRLYILITDFLKLRFYKFSLPSLRSIFNLRNLFCYTLYFHETQYKGYWIWHLLVVKRYYIWGALISPPLPIKCSYVGNEKCFGGTMTLKKEATVSYETWVSV